jgi:hypothetical protein
MTTIKDMVKDNKRVRFTFYRDRQLFYQTECGFEFRFLSMILEMRPSSRRTKPFCS